MKEATLDYTRYFWQGQKVRLRPMRVEDAKQRFIASLDSPARQVLQLGIELPTSVEEQRSCIEKWVGCRDADGVILFVIENLQGDNVGGISLHSRDPKNGVFSFGIVVDGLHRKSGYAEDAVRILLRYGFLERRYQKCDSACVDTNEAAIALHRKVGFIEEGRRRRRWFFNGEYYDAVLFGMTREEFDAREEG